MSLTDLPQLQHLTDREKLELIGELMESLENPETLPWAISDEEKAILDQRLAEHEANPGSALSLEEFRRRWAEMHPTAPITDEL
jgi:putative addiction module component (TIGR02574 family)